MTFIEVKGAADEPAFVKAEAIDAVEFYEPRGNLRIYTRSGRTYYSDLKPDEFLKKVLRLLEWGTLPEAPTSATLEIKPKETKRG